MLLQICQIKLSSLGVYITDSKEAVVGLTKSSKIIICIQFAPLGNDSGHFP